MDRLVGKKGAATEIESSSDRVMAARRLYHEFLLEVADYVRFFELRNRRNVPVYDLFFASNHPLGHYRMKEAMWKVDENGTYRFSDGVDPAQATLFSPTPASDCAPELWEQFHGETVLSEDALEYTRDHTAFLEKHARWALKRLENVDVGDKRINVAPKKKDGKPRKKGTFPTGAIITFTE